MAWVNRGFRFGTASAVSSCGVEETVASDLHTSIEALILDLAEVGLIACHDLPVLIAGEVAAAIVQPRSRESEKVSPQSL